MWRAIENMRARDVADPLWATHAKGESPWLTSAKLKLVDGCNLRCFMCEFWKLRRAGELTTEEVVRVLNELRQLGCLKVHFSGGEIFLRKDALALFRHAAGLGMRVNLTTNGTRIDKDTVKALIKLPVRSITLSIDSPVAQIHDTVRGRDGAFKRTVKTLDRLLERRTRKTRIRINTVISPRNIASMVEMPAFLRTRPVDGWLVIPMDPRNGHDPGWTPEVIAHYNAHIAPTLARDVTVPGFDPWIFGQTTESMHACASSNYARGYYAQHMCRVPWFHTLISATGDVYPCCMGHRRLPALGNVRATSLIELFNGPDYQQFRRRMRRERTSVCHSCDDFLAENRAYNTMIDERGIHEPPQEAS